MGLKGLSLPKIFFEKEEKQNNDFCKSWRAATMTRTTNTNDRTNVYKYSQKPEKSMSAPIFRISNDLFVLFAIPTSCSYQQ